MHAHAIVLNAKYAIEICCGTTKLPLAARLIKSPLFLPHFYFSTPLVASPIWQEATLPCLLPYHFLRGISPALSSKATPLFRYFFTNLASHDPAGVWAARLFFQGCYSSTGFRRKGESNTPTHAGGF